MTKAPWPDEIMEYKRKANEWAIEVCKEAGLPINDGQPFEPCAYDVEMERRELEKQDRHRYIDRHREE